MDIVTPSASNHPPSPPNTNLSASPTLEEPKNSSTSVIATIGTAEVTKKSKNKKSKNKKKKKRLEVRDLPSIDKIYRAIPAEGITLHELVKKFDDQIDDTNAQLFIELLTEISASMTKAWITPLPQLPSQERVQAVINAAKAPIEPLPRLEKEQEREVFSRLLEDINVTFAERSELIRGATRKMIPENFYRVQYEDSATLCQFVSVDTHSKHREAPKLKIQSGNAFQSIAKFLAARDLTTQRIERHFCWQQKREPSSYISAFNELSHAKARAAWHYDKSARIGHRTSIAEIYATGLVAATVRAEIEETVKIYTREKHSRERTLEDSTTTIRKVNIPVWVRRTAMPTDRSFITAQELKESKGDVWLSVAELRFSDLKVNCAWGHRYEWLACGVVPTTYVKRMMPYDGVTLHEARPDTVVRSVSSNPPWIYDWTSWMWEPEQLQADGNSTQAVATRSTRNKRKASADHEDASNGRSKLKKRTRYTSESGDESGSEDTPQACPTCHRPWDDDEEFE